jgi:FAD/FMN-containing dehydrogenase
MRLDILQEKAKEITAAVERHSDDMLHIAPWLPEEVPRIIEHCIACDAPLVVGDGVLSQGVRFDLTKLQHMKPDEESMIVYAQAGITFGQLEAKLHDYQLTLGSFAGELRAHTVGGAIAGRSYWKLGRYFSYWEDPLLALEVILPNGNFYRSTPSPRKATGPDLMRMLAGSEGALGIVMGAQLRVYRRNRSAREAAWRFASMQEAGIAARRLLRDGLCCAVLFAKETKEGAITAARWEGSSSMLQQERLTAAEEILGATSADPNELIKELLAAPTEVLRGPLSEVFVPYEEINAVLEKCPERTGARVLAKLPELALLFIEGVEASKVFTLAQEHRGVASPASAMYEAGDTFGAKTLGAALAPLREMKRELDPKRLFAPHALGL